MILIIVNILVTPMYSVQPIQGVRVVLKHRREAHGNGMVSAHGDRLTEEYGHFCTRPSDIARNLDLGESIQTAPGSSDKRAGNNLRQVVHNHLPL